VRDLDENLSAIFLLPGDIPNPVLQVITISPHNIIITARLEGRQPVSCGWTTIGDKPETPAAYRFIDMYVLDYLALRDALSRP
jgi:hypothetical protein